MHSYIHDLNFSHNINQTWSETFLRSYKRWLEKPRSLARSTLPICSLFLILTSLPAFAHSGGGGGADPGEDSEPHLEAPTVIEDRLYGTDANEELSASRFHVTEVQGNYGNDTILGSLNDDRLNGGHGEDRLIGKAGRDLLVSRSDGREPPIAQEYDANDDPNHPVNPKTHTLYRDQPIKADDILVGGADADTFRFEVLINAKKDIILKHVRKNGEINWGGVAGENNRVHDHWVDRLGDELILDFNRAEGDKIEIAGHTVDVYKVLHQDYDGDGVLDSTVLYLQSNQGNGGGAHDKDKLGTITVFGDLVTKADYSVDAGKNYGIVDTVDELEQALAPRVNPGKDDGRPPKATNVDDGQLPEGAVLFLPGEVAFSGKRGDHIEIAHHAGLELEEGTVTLHFVADRVSGRHTLFSKDASGQEIGGHLTAFVHEGRVAVRFQSIEESVWATTRKGSVKAGERHHLAVTFGPSGYRLYLDGHIVFLNAAFTQAINLNMENLAIAANTWARKKDRHPFATQDNLDGRIENFTIYRSQLSQRKISELASQVPKTEEPPTDPIVIKERLYGTDKNEELSANDHGVNDIFGAYGDDKLVGTSKEDRINGGHGLDQLQGGAGNDVLLSRSDGREPRIAQEYGRDDDPEREINRTTRTLYPNQPIEADDILIGGKGADTFRFEVLINAKRNIILKHVEANGRINWTGVAGENNRVHDHWVDRLGDEMILDFNRADGDKIEIVGHTVDVYKVEHQDSDRDGVLDSTVLYIQSNQGNGGGAHNKDKLGTISVFGDLVTGADYTVDASKNYGIVETIAELGEALAPRVDTGKDDGIRPKAPEVDDGELPRDAVLSIAGELTFSGEEEDHIEIEHSPDLEKKNGTVALNFLVENLKEPQALFSKDASGQEIGGHLTAVVHEGRVEVRLQSTKKSVYLKTAFGSVQEGKEQHLAVSFGSDGFWVYLDGRVAGLNAEFTHGLSANKEDLIIGASAAARSKKRPDKFREYLDGSVENFTIYGRQLDQDEVEELVKHQNDDDHGQGDHHDTEDGGDQDIEEDQDHEDNQEHEEGGQDNEDDQEHDDNHDHEDDHGQGDDNDTFAPTVEIVATPIEGTKPLTVEFTASGSDPDGGRVVYSWNFGDGSDRSVERNPVHVYGRSGVHTAVVTVKDDEGEVASATVDITVLPDLPIGPNPQPPAPPAAADTQPPTIDNCPADIVTVNEPGLISAVVTWLEPTASDNVNVATFTASHTPGDIFPFGTTLVSYTATDSAGNSTTCEFQVTVGFELTLTVGWNLVSIPLTPELDIDELLGDRLIGDVLTWSDGGYASATEFAPGRGFWLYSVEASTIDIFGELNETVDNEYIELQSGWNLYGPVEPVQNPYNDQIEGEIWYWQDGAYHDVSRDDGTLKIGKAYWIKSGVKQRYP